MISPEAWLNGGSALGIIVCTMLLCLFFLYRSRKLQLRLLLVAAFMVLFSGFLWLGPCSDFISLTFTGTHLEPIELEGILSYFWVAPALIFGIYIGAQLIFPTRKWLIVATFIILGVIFEAFLFLDTANTFTYESLPDEIIDTSFQMTSPTFILVAIFLVSILLMNGFGFLYRAFKLQNPIRRKYLLLSLTFLLFCVCAAVDAFIQAAFGLVIVRSGVILVAILLYYGLKPT